MCAHMYLRYLHTYTLTYLVVETPHGFARQGKLPLLVARAVRNATRRPLLGIAIETMLLYVMYNDDDD